MMCYLDELSLDVDGREVHLVNRDTLTFEEWMRACRKIEIALESWNGNSYDDNNKTYNSQVNLDGGKVVAFEMEANVDEDGITFGDSVELKRVR